MELKTGALALQERYKLLTALVFPRPIALISTLNENGIANCAPYSYARDGAIDSVTKRVSETAYRPVGRLFGTRYCTTRQRFDLPGPLPAE